MMTSFSEHGALLTVKQTAEILFGANYDETAVNRLYRMIKKNQIEYSIVGDRKFIPNWQVEKLCKRQQPISNVVSFDDNSSN